MTHYLYSIYLNTLTFLVSYDQLTILSPCNNIYMQYYMYTCNKSMHATCSMLQCNKCNILTNQISGNPVMYTTLIKYIGTIPKRPSTDKTTNAYCDVFIDFLQNMKLCTLNGRITPEFNNLTCKNTMGNFIIDYIITEHRSINRC